MGSKLSALGFSYLFKNLSRSASIFIFDEQQ
jgi:hypothetical protein